MAVLLKKYNLLFLAQPRTASNSIAEALFTLGGEKIGGHHNFGFVELQARGIKHENLLIFSAVRNHFDMLTSIWLKAILWKHDIQIPFNEWIDCICSHEMSTDMANLLFVKNNKGRSIMVRKDNQNWLYHYHAGASNKVIQFENLQSGLDSILKMVGAPTIEIPILNATPHKRPYQEYYTDKGISKVKSIFSAELNKYNYSFENGAKWQPRDDSLTIDHGGGNAKAGKLILKPFPGYPDKSFPNS